MKCFISREYGLSSDIINSVQEVLLKLNIASIDLYSEGIQENIRINFSNNINDADFIIGILERYSPNVLFELGIAVGINKPVFLLLDEDVSMPFDFRGMTYIKINKNLKSNLLLPLQCFVKNMGYKDDSNVDTLDNIRIDIAEENKLEQLDKIRKEGNREDYERFVKDLFDEISQQYVAIKYNMARHDAGYDFVVWADELEKKIANPLYFELKFGSIRSLRLDEVYHKAETLMQDGGILIVLCCDRNKKNVSHKNSFGLKKVIVLDIDKFVHMVGKYGFTNAIVYSRNYIAHGKEF